MNNDYNSYQINDESIRDSDKYTNEIVGALKALTVKAEKEFFPWILDEVIVETPDQLKNMSDLLGIGKKLEAEVEKARMDEKKPYLDGAKEVDAKYMPVKNRIHIGVTKIDQAIITYHSNQKKLADELITFQAEEQAKKIAEAKETGEIIEHENLIVEPVKDTVRGYMGTTGIQETPEFTITNENLVSRDLCSPDLKKIKAFYQFLKSTGKPIDIPGVMVTYKKHTVSRFG